MDAFALPNPRWLHRGRIGAADLGVFAVIWILLAARNDSSRRCALMIETQLRAQLGVSCYCVDLLHCGLQFQLRKAMKDGPSKISLMSTTDLRPNTVVRRIWDSKSFSVDDAWRTITVPLSTIRSVTGNTCTSVIRRGVMFRIKNYGQYIGLRVYRGAFIIEQMPVDP